MSLQTSPPPLPRGEGAPTQPVLSVFLSLVLAVFLGSAVLSVLSDSLVLFFHRQDLAITAGLGFLLMGFLALVTYGLLALVPAIPKRIFLPISLFIPVVFSVMLPLLVYFIAHAQLIVLGASLCQILFALFLIRRVQGGWKFRWPLFPERQFTNRRFSWGNCVGVILAGGLLLGPALVLSAAFSVRLAVGHFTDGFVALQSSGISMQVRKYVRDDGKQIMLVPMSHVGEPEFYQELAASFPANAVILMEGVTDSHQVTTTPLDYSRAAASIGGVEQRKAFKPQGEIVPADVDMSSFSPATLDLLKTAMLVHAKGVTAETLPVLMKPTPPGFEQLLMDDLLTKRNRHLLGVLQERLPRADHIVVPWGAAHMPEIAREIQKLGFRMVETQEFLAIRFGW